MNMRPLLIPRGRGGRDSSSSLAPQKFLSQKMGLRAGMRALGFNPREERLPLPVPSEEKLEMPEGRSPQQPEYAPKRRQCILLLQELAQLKPLPTKRTKGPETLAWNGAREAEKEQGAGGLVAGNMPALCARENSEVKGSYRLPAAAPGGTRSSLRLWPSDAAWPDTVVRTLLSPLQCLPPCLLNLENNFPSSGTAVGSKLQPEPKPSKV